MKVSQKDLGKNAVGLSTSPSEGEIVFAVATHLLIQTKIAEDLSQLVPIGRSRVSRQCKFLPIKCQHGGPAVTKEGELKDICRGLGNGSLGQTLSGQA